MLSCKGYQFFIVAHYDLSGWVEAKSLCTFFSWAVTDFLWEDIIYCYSCFGKLIIGKGSENKDAVTELTQRCRIESVVVSTYHPQANKMIKRRYKLNINDFSKMLDGGSTN